MLIWEAQPAPAQSGEFSPNIDDLYAYLNFNPAASNCGILVQLSDIHMSLNPFNALANRPPIRTNLPAELVSMIHAMNPQPTAMLVTGDVAMEAPSSFGGRARTNHAIPELIHAKAALDQFTNFPVYVVPGNHDGDASEVEGAPLFNSIFTNISRFTNFVVAGVPVIALHGHAGGWLDNEQIEWLERLRPNLDLNRPVIIAVHQPPLKEPDLHRHIRWFLRPWNAPVYVMSGHAHYGSQDVFSFERTKLYHVVCRAVVGGFSWGQTSPPTNTDPRATGFNVWCITNGAVAGVINGFIPIPTTNWWSNTWHLTYPSLTNAGYFVRNFVPQQMPEQVYHSWTNVLFHADEGFFDREQYEVLTAPVTNRDSRVLWAYVNTYRCRLPIESYPQATHALMACDTTNLVQFSFSSDATNWTFAPTEAFRNGGASILIPPEFRTGPLYFRLTRPNDNSFVWGFGLMTTNAINDFHDWLGKNVGNSQLDPRTQLPGAEVPAWTAHVLGLDPHHQDRLPVMPGAPWLGGWPSAGNHSFRFAGRTGVTYLVYEADSAGGPWALSTDFIVGPITNGWQEWNISNAAPQRLYHITTPLP